jgi:hypothetical protein
MRVRKLPLNTWIVIEQHAAWEDVVLVSRHASQIAAEKARDRRNRSSRERPYRACIVLEPIAHRMGGQLAPTARAGAQPRSALRVERR